MANSYKCKGPQKSFHTFIETLTFSFNINLKMFTETVPSRTIAMESKAMSIECKTEFHKNYANINMQYTYMFLFFSFSHTKYRLQKHK